MNRRYTPSATLLLHIAVMVLAACAASGPRDKVQLAPAGPAPQVRDIQLRSPALVRVGVGYGGELPAGSRWRVVGSVPQGTVYRPLNLVFMLDGRSPSEGYPVVQGAQLKGFFVPGQARFEPVQRPVELALASPLTPR